MLSHGRVHADLSAFNVLYWQGDYRIIDFPQSVDPEVHSAAFPLFERDVVRLCQYFSRYGIVADGAGSRAFDVGAAPERFVARQTKARGCVLKRRPAFGQRV